jgi:hypothetical protein
MRKSSRRHHHHTQPQQNRHSAHNFPYENSTNDQQSEHKGLDVSHDALQALLNSRFKLIDLVDLLKKSYPKLFSNDHKRELQFIEQLSETNNGERFIRMSNFYLLFFLY